MRRIGENVFVYFTPRQQICAVWKLLIQLETDKFITNSCIMSVRVWMSPGTVCPLSPSGATVRVRVRVYRSCAFADDLANSITHSHASVTRRLMSAASAAVKRLNNFFDRNATFDGVKQKYGNNELLLLLLLLYGCWRTVSHSLSEESPEFKGSSRTSALERGTHFDTENFTNNPPLSRKRCKIGTTVIYYYSHIGSRMQASHW